jgi:predicted nucleotidyltransferase
MQLNNNFILRNVVQDLKSRFNELLVSVIQFGSTAREMSKEYSDIDLLVLLEDLDHSSKEKSELEFQLSWEWQEKFNKKIDLLILSSQDAIDNFEVHSPLFTTLALGVKIYYDKEEFFLKNFNSFLNKLKTQRYYYTDSVTTWDLSQQATDLLNSQENLSEWLSTI